MSTVKETAAQEARRFSRLNRTFTQHPGLRAGCRAARPLCILLLIAVAGVLLYGPAQQPAHAQDVHIANRRYSQDEVFKILGRLNAENGAPMEHSSVVDFNGYVVQVYSEENDQPRAGIAAFDLSDPTQPERVAHTDNETGKLAEQHAIGFAKWQGRDLVALLAIDGVEIWDWTDMQNMHRVGRIELPGVRFGYARGAWWLAWQAPYLYVSGAGNGVYIVNTADPANPVLIQRDDGPNPIPNAETGGFRAGPIFAVGNLLVLTANDGRGYATLDIGDPANPQLLDVLAGRDAEPSYSATLNGNRLYAAGTDDDLHGLDISNPYDIRELATIPMQGRGGYVSIQDNVAHVGASSHYIKIDVSDDESYRALGTASSALEEHDEDFAVALGNLVVLSDDLYNGSFIFPHRAEPDTTGPEVNMVAPSDHAGGQSRATRIGVTFSDRVDMRTVTPETFIVRRVDDDEERVDGAFSGQIGIVNFTPAQPLEADATYEVVIPAGGVRDVVGNPTATTFRSTFSTGDDVGASYWCELAPPSPVLVGEEVDLHVNVIEGPFHATYRWRFGDERSSGGSSLESQETSTPSAQHAFSAPGHYPVRVTVSDGRTTASCTTLVTVYARHAPGHPRQNSSIMLDQSGTQVWNVNPDNDSVTVIDAVRMEKMAEIPAGDKPRSLAQAPDGTVWVLNQRSAAIHVFAADSRARLAEIPLPTGSEPYGLVFNPRRPVAYVSLQATGQVAQIDAGSRQVTGYLDVGPTPRALAVTADGARLFVSRWISPPEHGEVYAIDTEGWALRRRITLPYDPGPDAEDAGRGVPNGLAALAVSPTGDHLWVGARKHNTARGQQRDGKQLTFETTVRSILAQVDLASGEEALANRYDFNNRDGPSALTFTPLGDYLYAALEGSNAVDIIDPYSNQLVAAIEDVGHAPQGLVFTTDGSKLFVHSWLDRNVTVYDATLEVGRGPGQARRLASIATVQEESLSQDELLGKQIFYNARDPRMGRDGYIACASCHLDSGEDGRVWDRTAEGEGLRNTISLWGKGAGGHGLIHWSGNFDEIQDFEMDMRNNFGGIGFLPDTVLAEGTRAQPLGDAKANLNAELDALAAYVNSLRTLPPSPHRGTDGDLTAEARAGREVFQAAECAACHGGPQFTDSPTGMRHDVGTISSPPDQRLGEPLAGLDTPSLRGLWLSPPYLHDGSAATLTDIFTTQDPSRIHGNLQAVQEENPQALDQLIAYLRQIDDRAAAPPPSSPAVEFAAPRDGAQFAPGRPIRLAVNTSPALGDVARVEFWQGTTQLGEDNDVLYTYTWADPPAGEHRLTARLVYANGAVSISPPIQINVAP